MGTDISTTCERRTPDGQYVAVTSKELAPFKNRCYGVFAFLAGVRNYSGIQPIVEPRGKPDDYPEVTEEDWRNYGTDNPTTWLLVSELTSFDYDTEMEDRRVSVNGNGGCTCPVGDGAKMPWREFLGESFFSDLDTLVSEKIDRVVFWFD